MASVMIVEDDRDTREMLARFLELEGFDVREAANGQLALEALREDSRTCVILLDLMMPVMNGWQFRERQLEDTVLAEIPLVVITADGNAAIKAKELSADDYLQKPLRPEKLLATVARYCAEPT